MRKSGTIVVAAGAILFVVGLITLANSSAGILLMLLGIVAMLIGSIFMMRLSGKVNADYAADVTTYPTDQAVPKADLPAEERK